MTTTTAELDPITAELETRKAELEQAAARKRERQAEIDRCTADVKHAQTLLDSLTAREQSAVARIAQLNVMILNLSASGPLSYAHNDPYTQLVECYKSVAALNSLIADAPRVREFLNDKLVAAKQTLKAATR